MLNILFIKIIPFLIGLLGPPVMAIAVTQSPYDREAALVSGEILSTREYISSTPTQSVTTTPTSTPVATMTISPTKFYVITITPTRIFTPTRVPTATKSLIPTTRPTNTPTPTVRPTSIPTGSPTPMQPTVTPIVTQNVGTQPTSQQLDSWFDTYSGVYGVNRSKLWQLAVCESGLNTNATNGIYGGLYQFSSSSWQSARTQMHMDINADLRFNAEESIRTAAYKISVSGYGAWPYCQNKYSM